MKKKELIFLILPLILGVTGCKNIKEYNIKDYEINVSFKNDNFKIMQLTDIHLGIETDNEKEMNQIDKYIKLNNPDLIIITGDSFLDATKDIVKYFVSRIDSNNIPWAFTYGNHDNQGCYGEYFINDTIKKSKNALFVDYDDDVLSGKTNYYINLKNDTNKTLYRLYIIDSGSYYYIGPKYKYDIIHDEQLKHIQNIYNIDKAFGLAFFHIPLVEYQETYDRYLANEVIGKGLNNEKSCPGYKNNNALQIMYESGIRASFVGHDHINYSDLIYDKFDEDFILSYGVKATKTIYANEDVIGCKMITLNKNNIGISLDDIEAKFYDYD